MKSLVIAAALAVGHFLLNSSAAFSQERAGLGLLSPSESRAYHACLFAAWVEDYCRENSWRLDARYSRVYNTCVIANGGGRFPLYGRTWYNTDDFCWSEAHGVSR
jgi:hypothetical protein